MNRSNVSLFVIIILALALIACYVFWPASQDVEIIKLRQENDSLMLRIADGEQKQVKLRHRIDSLALSSTISDSVYKHTVSKKDREIAYYRQNPRVVEIIRENPVIDSAFRAYDSALTYRDVRIRQLESELGSALKMAVAADENFKTTIADYKNIHANMLAQVEHYRKELRKQRRQKRLAIGLGILIGGAGVAL